MTAFPLPLLWIVFAVSAGVIWFAGVRLANTTDILSSRLGWGEALGGVILLAVATNLPELAITISAAWTGKLDVAVANILGGIAIQTVVLAFIDVGMKERVPLTWRAASLALVIEAVLVVAVVTVAIMATQLPADLIAFRMTPGALAITAVWVAGVWLTGRASNGLPWREADGTAPGAQEQPQGHSQALKDKALAKDRSTGFVWLVFAVAAVATLVAGVALEQAGEVIADRIGLSGAVFAATVLAAATSLPELSTGIASVRMKDYQLAVSDIFGGNAFLPVLVLLAVLISGQAVLPVSGAGMVYLAALGILLTCVYAAGLLFRPKRIVLRMGMDSLAVVLLYALGIAGYAMIA